MSEKTQVVWLLGTLIARLPKYQLHVRLLTMEPYVRPFETDPNETGAFVKLSELAAAIATLPQLDPSNHHNALKCPYCNPDGLVLALPSAPPQDDLFKGNNILD